MKGLIEHHQIAARSVLLPESKTKHKKNQIPPIYAEIYSRIGNLRERTEEQQPLDVGLPGTECRQKDEIFYTTER